MKAQDKPQYVSEARKLFESLEIEKLKKDPNDLTAISKINRLIAIFTNFSYNDGQELRRLFLEFQDQARHSTSIGTIGNRAVDMMQFIGQKIEEMDIYEIEEPMEDVQQKIVKKLKDDKLWVRSSLEGKDLHIQIGKRDDKKGEHIHLISDSQTGELRVHADDKAPNELVERVVAVVMKGGPTIGVSQQGIKTTMEFVDTNVTSSQNNPPILYATGIRHSGGPTGHFVFFTLKNIGKEIALDIHWGIRGFAFEWRPEDEPFELEPNKEKEVVFPISSEKIFRETIQELNIIMEYKGTDGTSYFTRRELEQVLVPSGAFFNLKANTFYPPSILIDDGLRLLSEPVRNGDKVEAVFSINTKDSVKEVTIGMSRSLTSVLGLENDSQIKQAIQELAHRKIRKMIKEDNLTDYLFTTYELPEHNEGGFGTYIKLRDSIT
ncbi:MAG: hypothetical protein WCT85_00855 [Parachlamydiales bacterium]